MTLVRQQNSNTTETRWARETAFKTVGGSEVWQLIEPNSFSDAAAKFSKTSRNPINNDRQRQKGVLTDLDCSFGFQTDLTQYNSQDLLQGLFRAALRNQAQFGGAGQLLTVNGANGFTAASGLTVFPVGTLVQLRNSDKTLGNSNRLLRVTVSTSTTLTVAETLAAETLPAGALLVAVGFQTSAGDIDVDASQPFPALTSTTFNFLTGASLVVGSYIWIGGDAALSFFPTNAVNNCLARIRTIAANRLTLDKCSKGAMITEAQAGSTIQLFFGRTLKNELGSLIIRPSYQLEMQLNASDDAAPAQVQSQYFTGGVYSQATFNLNQADKITIDAKFTAADQEVRTGVTGLKAGTRPAIESADAQNTTSDLKRVKLAQVISGNESPTPLVAFIKSGTLNIDNGDQPLKALTVLGAFEMSSGDFTVSGNLDAYFASVDVLTAVRDNLSCTLDIFEWKQNSGWCLDLPLITLSDASVTPSKDSSIMLPLAFDAASGQEVDQALDFTCSITFHDFLPNLAQLTTLV
jgi:tail tube protein